ncbi:hypothetical protein T484DRAFT_1911162, partial [Baffinella frigidus]
MDRCGRNLCWRTAVSWRYLQSQSSCRRSSPKRQPHHQHLSQRQPHHFPRRRLHRRASGCHSLRALGRNTPPSPQEAMPTSCNGRRLQHSSPGLPLRTSRRTPTPTSCGRPRRTRAGNAPTQSLPPPGCLLECPPGRHGRTRLPGWRGGALGRRSGARGMDTCRRGLLLLLIIRRHLTTRGRPRLTAGTGWAGGWGAILLNRPTRPPRPPRTRPLPQTRHRASTRQRGGWRPRSRSVHRSPRCTCSDHASRSSPTSTSSSRSRSSPTSTSSSRSRRSIGWSGWLRSRGRGR